MGYSRSDTAHKWAHQLKERVAQSDNLWAEGPRIFSYSTVIGDILTFKNGNRAYILQGGSFSSSTSKHQGYVRSAIPDSKAIINLPSAIWGWRGYSGYAAHCGDLASQETQMVFLFDRAFDLLGNIEEFVDSKSIDTERMGSAQDTWSIMLRFCELSGEVSISKLLRAKSSEWRTNMCDWYRSCKPERIKKVRKAVKCFHDGMTLQQTVDAVCGKGTWTAYLERTKGARSSERVRKFKSWCRGGDFGIKEIRKWEKDGTLYRNLVDIKKRNVIHNNATNEINVRRERVGEAKQRLELHIGCLVEYTKKWYRHYTVDTFTHNGETIPLRIGYHTLESRHLSSEEYERFGRMSSQEREAFIQEKRDWLFQDFKQQTEDYHQREREREEYCERLRAEQKEREERESRFRQFIESKKQEGGDGWRELYHDGYIDSMFSAPQDTFYAGNVLLRFNEKKNLVETSKGMVLTVDECHRLWLLIMRWHENQASFQSGEVARTSGYHPWEIRAYLHDVLHSGCHSIDYKEMRYLAGKLGFLQAS